MERNYIESEDQSLLNESAIFVKVLPFIKEKIKLFSSSSFLEKQLIDKIRSYHKEAIIAQYTKNSESWSCNVDAPIKHAAISILDHRFSFECMQEIRSMITGANTSLAKTLISETETPLCKLCSEEEKMSIAEVLKMNWFVPEISTMITKSLLPSQLAYLDCLAIAHEIVGLLSDGEEQDKEILVQRYYLTKYLFGGDEAYLDLFNRQAKRSLSPEDIHLILTEIDQ